MRKRYVKPGSGSAAKTFCLLVLAQAICLGLGLWIENQFSAALTAEPAVSVGDEPHADSGDSAILGTMAFFWIAALQTVVAYLILSRVRSAASQKEHLAASELLRRQSDLVRTRDAIVFGLAKLAESRDPETGNHLERIAHYSTLLAKAVRRHPRYRDEISVSFIRLIGISSALHDIGKVGVPDSVLLKQGKLDEEQRREIEKHSEIGGRCIRGIELRLGGSNFLQLARQIALAHHEHWDGTGYPKGLEGEKIPLVARIVAIADVYDALTTKRIYKDAYSHERTVAIIRDGAGSHFDPDLVEIFLRIQAQFHDVARRCRDLDESESVPARNQETSDDSAGPSDEETSGRITAPPLPLPLSELDHVAEHSPSLDTH